MVTYICDGGPPMLVSTHGRAFGVAVTLSLSDHDTDEDISIVDAAAVSRVYKASLRRDNYNDLDIVPLERVPSAAGEPMDVATFGRGTTDGDNDFIVVGYRVAVPLDATAASHPRLWIVQAAQRETPDSFFTVDRRTDVSFDHTVAAAASARSITCWLSRPLAAAHFRLLVRGIRGVPGERGCLTTPVAACSAELLLAPRGGRGAAAVEALATTWGWRLLLTGPAGQRRLRLMTTDRRIDVVSRDCVPPHVNLHITAALICADEEAMHGTGEGSVRLRPVMLLAGQPLCIVGYQWLLRAQWGITGRQGSPCACSVADCVTYMCADAHKRIPACGGSRPCDACSGPSVTFDPRFLEVPRGSQVATASRFIAVFVGGPAFGRPVDVMIGGDAAARVDHGDQQTTPWWLSRAADDIGAAGEGSLAADAPAFPATRIGGFRGSIASLRVTTRLLSSVSALVDFAILAEAQSRVSNSEADVGAVMDAPVAPSPRTRDGPLRTLEHALLWRPNPLVDAAVRAVGAVLRPRYAQPSGEHDLRDGAVITPTAPGSANVLGCSIGVGHAGPLSLLAHDCGPTVYVEDVGGLDGGYVTRRRDPSCADGCAELDVEAVAARIAPASSQPLQNDNTPLGGSVSSVRTPDAFCRHFDGVAGAMPTTVGHIYRLRHWAHVDIFVYFSHHRLSIPPAGWIAAAHAHGVRILGTLITEWEDGEAANDMLCTDRDSPRGTLGVPVATALARLASYFNFDGWLVNIESRVRGGAAGTAAMRSWLAQLTSNVHATTVSAATSDGAIHCGRHTTPSCASCRSSVSPMPLPNHLVIWYDAVDASNGVVSWASALTDANTPFFDVCDGIFLDYHWQPDALRATAQRAAVSSPDQKSPADLHNIMSCRSRDVLVGIDVFGRGTWGGGQWRCVDALDAIKAASAARLAVDPTTAATDEMQLQPRQMQPLSVALFGASWAYETAGGSKSADAFASLEQRWWEGDRGTCGDATCEGRTIDNYDESDDEELDCENGSNDHVDSHDSGTSDLNALLSSDSAALEYSWLAIANANGEEGLPLCGASSLQLDAVEDKSPREKSRSWIATASGGDGWGVVPLEGVNRPPVIAGAPMAVPSTCFVTSHKWCRASQVIPVPAAALSAALAASERGTASILVREWFRGTPPATGDAYELTVQLLACGGEAGNTILATVTTGVMRCSAQWQQVALRIELPTVTTAPSGVDATSSADRQLPMTRYILHIEHGGVDAEGWAGHYGAMMCGLTAAVTWPQRRKSRQRLTLTRGVGVQLMCPTQAPLRSSQAQDAAVACGPFLHLVAFAEMHGVRPAAGMLPFSTNFHDGVGTDGFVGLAATQLQPSFSGWLARHGYIRRITGPVRTAGDGSGVAIFADALAVNSSVQHTPARWSSQLRSGLLYLGEAPTLQAHPAAMTTGARLCVWGSVTVASDTSWGDATSCSGAVNRRTGLACLRVFSLDIKPALKHGVCHDIAKEANKDIVVSLSCSATATASCSRLPRGKSCVHGVCRVAVIPLLLLADGRLLSPRGYAPYCDAAPTGWRCSVDHTFSTALSSTDGAGSPHNKCTYAASSDTCESALGMQGAVHVVELWLCIAGVIDGASPAMASMCECDALNVAISIANVSMRYGSC